jgi:hypothetical protein
MFGMEAETRAELAMPGSPGAVQPVIGRQEKQ